MTVLCCAYCFQFSIFDLGNVWSEVENGKTGESRHLTDGNEKPKRKKKIADFFNSSMENHSQASILSEEKHQIWDFTCIYWWGDKIFDTFSYKCYLMFFFVYYYTPYIWCLPSNKRKFASVMTNSKWIVNYESAWHIVIRVISSLLLQLLSTLWLFSNVTN